LSGVHAVTRHSVLLADDYPGVIAAYRRLLEPLFDIVGTATNGRAVLDAAITLEPDVIVLDLAMPQMNGLDACRFIKHAVPRTHIVFVTATDDPDIAEAAFHAGASAFVLKHAAALELPSAIRLALAGEMYCAPFVRRQML
jgi:DNA-binding NarL/FixJ family response regulator